MASLGMWGRGPFRQAVVRRFQMTTYARLKVSVVVCLAALLIAAFAAAPLVAQVDKATITGTVTDSSGASLVGAKVLAKNIDTGIEQSAVTDNQGRYRMADVAIGTYQVQASKEGFQTVVRKGVALTIGSQP